MAIDASGTIKYWQDGLPLGRLQSAQSAQGFRFWAGGLPVVYPSQPVTVSPISVSSTLVIGSVVVTVSTLTITVSPASVPSTLIIGSLVVTVSTLTITVSPASVASTLIIGSFVLTSTPLPLRGGVWLVSPRERTWPVSADVRKFLLAHT